MSPELASKRLEILRDVVPGLSRVAVLWEPGHVDTYYDELGKVATAIGVRLQMETLAKAADLEPAFAALRQPQALFVVPSRLTSVLTQRIVDLALAARLPAMSAYEAFAAAGGLMSYGAASADVLGRVAALIDRTLGGAQPAETPFELPTRFVLTVNLKTARQLGLAVPRSLLLRADDVID
jgi:putative ABC transport system substrate-binding protein